MSSLNVVKHGSGIVIRYQGLKIALDTSLPGRLTLLSHSHMDHISDLSDAAKVVTTKGTIDTYLARNGRVRWENIVVDYGDSYMSKGVEITPLNAGHVLGSSMFLLKFRDGLRLLYTGDFNNVDSIVHQAAEPTDADVLITEATYGSPYWVFPDRKSIHEDIVSRARMILSEDRIPVFQAYSLGKAQEALALLHRENLDAIGGNPPILEVNKVYCDYGAKLSLLSIDSANAFELLDSGCVIVSSHPGHTLRNLRRLVGDRKAREIEMRIEILNLSGWVLGNSIDTGFPLSAHTDFQGLIRFAKDVNPRVVYCFTDKANEFSTHLMDEGLKAVPLE
ncbi:MAG: hypothetical protein JSW61_04255 [Candidatus Thorarchaeota archaeon]|nr:MAG: hypothetical protein JSW61_04255 [Candidatus Thorarchaeota archaeon]